MQSVPVNMNLCFDLGIIYELYGKKDKKLTADALNIAWNDFGTRYRFHEYKDTFKGRGKRTIRRMCDRSHSWTTDRLETVIRLFVPIWWAAENSDIRR